MFEMLCDTVLIRVRLQVAFLVVALQVAGVCTHRAQVAQRFDWLRGVAFGGFH